jgi:PilZ domain
MQKPGTRIERRKHPRAPVRLPARIRWHGPFGMRVETTETIDISREGVLVQLQEAGCEPGTRVWIVFPYDRTAGASAEPETPATVARVMQRDDGNYRVGVRLAPRQREAPHRTLIERRRARRFPFALPILIRAAGAPWPEESMTHDFSLGGARFESPHVYRDGDAVIAEIPWGDWSKRGEIRGRVVRVEDFQDTEDRAAPRPPSSTILMSVAVEWLNGNAAEGTTES